MSIYKVKGIFNFNTIVWFSLITVSIGVLNINIFEEISQVCIPFKIFYWLLNYFLKLKYKDNHNYEAIFKFTVCLTFGICSLIAVTISKITFEKKVNDFKMIFLAAKHHIFFNLEK